METTTQTQHVPIQEVIKNFLFHCQYEKNLNGNTLRAYQVDLHQFSVYIQTLTGKTTMEAVSKESLKNYIQELSQFKPKTIKRKIASLKAMFNYLEYEEDNFVNPLRKIRFRYKEPFTLPSVMTIEEIRKILSFLHKCISHHGSHDNYTYKAQIRDLAIMEVLFATGIRVSELCNLTYETIDFKSGQIKVFGKGSKERIIQICHKETIAILKTYYKLYKPSIQKQGRFFINRLGNPLSTQSVRLMIKQYARKAGLTKPITPHTFRHTFATLLLEEEVDIKYIQHILGHSSIVTTQIYTHVNPEKQKKILATKHPRRKLKLDIE